LDCGLSTAWKSKGFGVLDGSASALSQDAAFRSGLCAGADSAIAFRHEVGCCDGLCVGGGTDQCVRRCGAVRELSLPLVCRAVNSGVRYLYWVDV
jgi:hypothetical protein